ncbi:transposase [Rhizobium sp. Nf11,1]|uniref:transposase n=1 Tax=Rhizobium sp. Nf11,1 TaxID=3404923 RepID=UPI003D33418F
METTRSFLRDAAASISIACKQRWGVESFFAKLKQWRRLAIRYDKLATNFIGFV